MRSPTLLLFILLITASSYRSSAQQPVLSSFPQAPATIYLDFDGHLVKGTSWNWNGDIDCSPSGLNLTQITEIFNRIAEDYRPFNVNITTDSTKYWAAPVLQRTRVIFTTTSSWYGPAGGVAFIGSFSWGDNTPAFVFSALLQNNVKLISEAASHEAGHTLGLKHQSSYNNSCQKTSEYNYGTGSGEIGWAPIMGAGYYQNLTLWNNGANPYGCTEYQDDLGVITSTDNGISYRTDDYGNQMASATLLNLSNNQLAAAGIIERSGDKDFFKFTIPVTGNFHIDGAPYSLGSNNSGSNLDMQLQLLDNTGNLIGSFNPSNYLSLSVDTVLSAGEYFMSVEGKGNVFAPEYASLGSYSLKASFTPPIILPLHQFTLAGETDGARHKLQWTIIADEAVTAQWLEAGNDPLSFSTVGSVKASERSLSFLSTPQEYFRMKVRFDNGHEYYSNVVRLRSDADKPHILGSNSAPVIQVTSPTNTAYQVVDMSGRIVQRGSLTAGLNYISATNLGSGLYILQIAYSGGRVTEKFTRP